MNQREAGKIAEKIAQTHLVSKGYKILEVNWQYHHLEIDIIARQGDELVIVEVKSREGFAFEHPLDAISPQKMQRLITAAEAYIELTDWNMDTRFDLITVVFDGGDGRHELEHYCNAFNSEA